MPRPMRGSVVEHVGKDGRTYRSLRFQAGGKRHRIALGPVSVEEAERRLAHAIADAERGILPATQSIDLPGKVQTFHEFAEEWWTRHEGQITKGTQADYRWRLQVHLIPYFGPLALDAITFDTVEKYIAAKLAGLIFENGVEVGKGDPLSARSINMHVTLLGAIMERALERGLISRNPAKGKGRRVRERAPTRSYLDAAGQITALLDAAGELDRKAPENRRHIERRAMIATLIFSGLRISELCALRWRDVDLAGGWLKVGDSKTDAGRRKVKIRGALRDELLAVRGRHQDAPQAAYVFGTLSGARMGPDNFRNRVLGKPGTIVDGERKGAAGAVGLATKQLEAEGLAPLPEKLTPHSLRRTFCSLLYALGETPPVVMQEMGHTDPGLALKVYAQSMRRGEDEVKQIREVVEGGAVVANSGQREQIEAAEGSDIEAG
jgi:integrase